MIDRKEIELLIRAQLKGGKDIASISKAIDELGQAIERQSAAAKRGESSIDELKASLTALRNAQDALTSQADLVGRFQRLAETVQNTQVRVDRSREALDSYANTLREAGEVSDAQQAKLTKLSAAYERASVTLERQQKQYAAIGASLREAGVDTNNLAEAENRLRTAAAQVGVTFQRGQAAVESYADDVRKAREATAALAKQQKEASREADLFAAAEKRAADAAAARARAAQDVADAASTRQGQSAASARADQEAQAALRRQQELAALRRDIEERSAQTQVTQRRDDGLRKTAQDAEEAARQYTTLARASNNLRPRIVSLREAIDGIVNPAAQARTTLAGVEQQVKAAADAAAGSSGEIKDLADQLKNLQAAQKAIGAQSGLIDDFRRQQDAVRAARTEFVAARAQVAQYAAAVRQGGEAGEQFTRPLAEAEARLRRSSGALRQQIEATRQSRDALRAAGVDTRNLADAQDRLTAAARQSTDAMQRLGAVAKTAADGGERAGKGFALFNDEGRTTLSLAQRIRGEILALAAAYVGLQGVLSLAQGSLRASKQFEGLENTIAFALGADGAQVAQQIQFLRSEADRLGISFEQASTAYAKFAASAIRSGAPVQEAQFIFESFAEVGRVINLTPDQLNGLFNAIGQSFSKGKIQAEELRQQIGERLPGAFAFAQEALRDLFPNLDKALEQGLVGAENFLLIAESVRRAAANQLPAAIRSLDAEQQRFNNSVLFFKKEIADSGFADAYVALLKELTELLQSSDGKELAQAISGAFEGVVEVIRFVIRNLEELKFVLGAVLGVFAVSLFGTLIGRVKDLSDAIRGLKTGLTALQRGIFILQALAVALAIGTYLVENREAISSYANFFVTQFRTLFSMALEEARVFFKRLPLIAAESIKSFLDQLPSEALLRRLLNYDNLERQLGSLRVSTEIDVARIRSEAAAARAKLKADYERDRDFQAAVNARPGDDRSDRRFFRRPTTPPQPRRPGSAPTGPTDAQLGARERKIESLDTALNALDARIQRAETQTLASQLKAFDLESQRLQNQINEVASFNPQAAAERQARFDTLRAEQRAAITQKFNDRIEASRLALLSRVEQAEAAAGRKEKTSLEARLGAIRDEYAKLYRDIEAERARRNLNALPTDDLDALASRTRDAQTGREAAETTAFNRDELQRRENQINALLRTREQTLRTINELATAGVITRQEADAQSLEFIERSQPAIENLASEGERFAAALQGAYDPALLQEFIARLQLARVSGAGLAVELDRTGTIIREGISQGINSSLNALADSLVEVTRGTKDWGDAFQAVGTTILQTLAQILREIAVAIIRQQILIALRAATAGTPFASLIPVAHSGMVVGRGSNRNRAVSTDWFANAPRYHRGGIVGLAPDEYPAILQKNEEVLSKSDPRNVLNGGLMGNAAQPKAQRFVLVDDRSRVAEAMSGAEGEEVTMVHLRKNIPTLRQLIRGG